MNFPPNPTTLRNEHVNMSLWPWTYEQEWIFLEYYDDVHNIFKISIYYISMMWKYFSTCTWMKVTNGWKIWMKVEHQWTFWMTNISWWTICMKILIGWNVWMELIPKQLCQMKNKFTWMKVTERWNIWMNVEHEWTFGWWLEIDELFGWNLWLVECMDESNSKIVMMNGNYFIHIIFHVQFHLKKKVSKAKLEGVTLQCKRVK
jgi:hypothetical protein